MKFIETKLKGVYIIEVEKFEDDRGFFARTFCRREFEAHGLNPDIAQCNVSFNKKRGTLRGMHYQIAPYQEAKLVTCLRGSLYDVIIDLRPDSLTYRQWFAVVLSAPWNVISKRSAASIVHFTSDISWLTAHSLHDATHGSQLTAHYRMVYIPEGFAHGFVTLMDNTEVFYQMSEFYMPEYARGIRWNDPVFEITWPFDIAVISEKDMRYPDFLS
jgi:dTDP-4-dehydrorhamnose 3,5-epimerase